MQANSLQEAIQLVNSNKYEMAQQYSLDQGQLHAHFNMRFMLANWELIFQFQCPFPSSLSQARGHHLLET